jgi:hypothetical protein
MGEDGHRCDRVFANVKELRSHANTGLLENDGENVTPRKGY